MTTAQHRAPSAKAPDSSNLKTTVIRMSSPDATDIAKGKLVAYLAVLKHNVESNVDPFDGDDDTVILAISPWLPSRLLPVEITLRDLKALTK